MTIKYEVVDHGSIDLADIRNPSLELAGRMNLNQTPEYLAQMVWLKIDKSIAKLTRVQHTPIAHGPHGEGLVAVSRGIPFTLTTTGPDISQEEMDQMADGIATYINEYIKSRQPDIFSLYRVELMSGPVSRVDGSNIDIFGEIGLEPKEMQITHRPVVKFALWNKACKGEHGHQD